MRKSAHRTYRQSRRSSKRREAARVKVNSWAGGARGMLPIAGRERCKGLEDAAADSCAAICQVFPAFAVQMGLNAANTKVQKMRSVRHAASCSRKDKDGMSQWDQAAAQRLRLLLITHNKSKPTENKLVCRAV